MNQEMCQECSNNLTHVNINLTQKININNLLDTNYLDIGPMSPGIIKQHCTVGSHKD